MQGSETTLVKRSSGRGGRRRSRCAGRHRRCGGLGTEAPLAEDTLLDTNVSGHVRVDPTIVRGITVVGLLVAALLYGRDLVAIAAGRVVEPLASARRRELLRVVQERQPVRLLELQEVTGMARGTLRHHVLCSAHILQTVTHAGNGRNTTFMLNGGSLMFRAGELAGAGGVASGNPDAVVAEALSAASTHPVRKAIFEHLLEHGPTEPAGLHPVAADAHGGRLAPSTLSYHLRILTEAGLVVRAGDSPRGPGGGSNSTVRPPDRNRYAACIDAKAARSRQYQNYLRRKEWNDAVHAVLEHGPTGPGVLVRRLVDEGHTPRAANAAVKDLVRRCILEFEDGRLHVNDVVARAFAPRGATWNAP